MMNYENYISIVLGESGVGKSSFINLITRSTNCKTSDRPEICTKKYNITRTIYNKSEYYFIDTPGFDDYGYGKAQFLNELKKSITEYPNIRCLIILKNFHDIRNSQNFLKFLKILMEYFPTKKFWEHVIIVRTHADKESYIFRKEKERTRLNINFIEDNIKDIINAQEKNEEYYVDCECNFEENEEQLEKIFNRIRMTPPIN